MPGDIFLFNLHGRDWEEDLLFYGGHSVMSSFLSSETEATRSPVRLYATDQTWPLWPSGPSAVSARARGGGRVAAVVVGGGQERTTGERDGRCRAQTETARK